jgi:hypothetical protein
METVESTYDICRTYKSGPSITYRILWSVSSEEFFTVKPVIQEVVDSIRFYEPA